MDLYESSAAAIKATFGPLLNTSPRSPFDIASSESDSSTGIGSSNASKKLDLRWTNAPPPLLVTWLMEPLVAAGKGPNDLLSIFSDTRICMRKRVYAQEEETKLKQNGVAPGREAADAANEQAQSRLAQMKTQVREELSTSTPKDEADGGDPNAARKATLKRYRFEHVEM